MEGAGYPRSFYRQVKRYLQEIAHFQYVPTPTHGLARDFFHYCSRYVYMTKNPIDLVDASIEKLIDQLEKLRQLHVFTDDEALNLLGDLSK